MGFVITLAACRKEHISENSLSIPISTASAAPLAEWHVDYLKKHSGQLGFLSSLKPNWEKAYQTKDGELTVYEALCANPDKLISGAEHLDDMKKEELFQKTVIKLLLFVDAKNNKTGAYMLITGNNNKTEELHYKNMPTNFTGRVMYYTLDSQFANGWLYENGKATHSLALSKDKTTLLNAPTKMLSTKGSSSPKPNTTMVIDENGCLVNTYPVYGQQCNTVYPIEGLPGDPLTTCHWVVVGVDSTTVCPNPGDGGYIPPGSGNNPPTNPPTDPPAEPDPCAQAKKMNQSTSYNSETTDLKAKVDDLTLTREVGYVKKVGSPAVYKDPGVTGLEFPIPQLHELTAHSLEYFNHTHYVDPKALSTFGFDDFFTFCKYLATDRVADINTFTVGVTTSYGSYAFVLDDLTKFNTYLQSTINDLWASYDLSQAFEVQGTGVHELNTGAVNEANLLKILKDSGIGLLKKDPTTGTFKLLKVDANGNVQIINCGGSGGIE